MLSDTWRMEPPFIFLMHRFRLRIDQPIHRILGVTMSTITILIIRDVATHARPSTGASALTLIVARECIPACEPTPTFRTDMRPLSGMKLGVPFQIVKSPEARLAGLADIRLFLAVSEQMTLQIMMPRKLGSTVRTTVFLGPRRTLTTAAEARTW